MTTKKLFPNDYVNKITQGSCIEILREIPSDSIDCSITSPPYWGLRSYGTNPQVWGDPNCEHEWEEYLRPGNTWGTPNKNVPGMVHKSVETNHSFFGEQKQGTCKKCGAWLGELGLEPKFTSYVHHLCDIYDEIRRILKPEGTCWVNIGDTYASSQKGSGGKGYKQDTVRGSHFGRIELKPEVQDKCLCMIPSRFAIEMVNRGWILRNEIIWWKPNCMPTSIKDRFTVDYERIYFFTKSKKYHFETQYEPHAESSLKARNAKLNQTTHPGAKMSAVNVQLGDEPRGTRFIPEEGRNKRCVWRINTKPFREAHFATFPEELVETPIKAGCPEGGIVLDPFMGAGTTAIVARKLNRNFIGTELNPAYIEIAYNRIIKTLSELKNKE